MLALIFIPSLYLISSATFSQDWTGISDCGTYQVNGIARSTKKGLVIMVNEKTQSEITITTPILNETYLAPYVDKALKASVVFAKKSPGSKALGTIKEIESRVPNPLNPMDTGIKLISKAKCE